MEHGMPTWDAATAKVGAIYGDIRNDPPIDEQTIPAETN